MTLVSESMTVEQVEQLMELTPGAIGAVAWLVMREQAAGISRVDSAEALGVTPEEVVELIESTTGEQGADAEVVWMKGVIALRTSAMLNEQTINAGWDSLEAMSLQKLNQAMSKLRGDGDPEMMLKIAQVANSAKRRNRGEGVGTRVGVSIHGRAAEDGVKMELESGHLGFLRLNLSPSIQRQLSNPDRVIDGVAKRVGPGGLDQKLEMMTLEETRKLGKTVEGAPVEGAPGKGKLESKADKFDLSDLIGAANA